MTDVRQFIRNLGDQAPAYFNTTDKTIKRWLKTGNLPIKAFERIDMAVRATANQGQPEQRAPEPGIDPYTKLPLNIDRRLPEIQVQAGGRLPDTIEINPAEQSFGVNMTRPGRLSTTVMPPMKIKEEGGAKFAYQENTPPIGENPNLVLPPSISKEAGWGEKGPPLPAPRKAKNPNEPRSAQG